MYLITDLKGKTLLNVLFRPSETYLVSLRIILSVFRQIFTDFFASCLGILEYGLFPLDSQTSSSQGFILMSENLALWSYLPKQWISFHHRIFKAVYVTDNVFYN